MIKRGMSYEKVKAMVKEMNWEVMEEKARKKYGKEWTEMTIWQDDHAVIVQVDEEGVYEIQFIPPLVL